MARSAKLQIVIGGKGKGKTTVTKKFLRQYVAGNPATGAHGRKVIIIDTQHEYSMEPDIKALAINQISLFAVHPEISIKRIPPFKLQTGEEMTPDEKADAVVHVLKKFRNGLVVLEDINEYISDYMPTDVVGIILSQRHKGIDVVIHYHSMGRVQKKLWPHVSLIRMHKCNDSVIDNRDKFPDKFECFKIAENIVDNQFADGNIYFFLYIDFENQKILCNVTTEERDKAIEYYLLEFGSKRIKSIDNVLKKGSSLSYKTLDDYQTGFDTEKERIIKTYFPR